MNKVFFSVVVPLFNKEGYVERAIESILKQSFNNFELIVVDDGSTDGGTEKVKSFEDSRVRLFTQSNQGEGPARNAGIKQASGKWVAFLDADDMWLPTHLSCLKKAIDAFDGLGMVGCGSTELQNGELPNGVGGAYIGSPRKVNYFSAASRKIGIINSSSVAIRRDVFTKVGDFENYRMGCDLEFWARVALEFSVAINDEVTSVYFRGTGGVMESKENKPNPAFRPLPTSLEEISPSVAMLSERLDSLPQRSELRMSVVGYINSRLVQAMRGALIEGDIRRVKTLRALFLQPLAEAQERIWWALAGMPTFVLASISCVRAHSKRAFLALKRL